MIYNKPVQRTGEPKNVLKNEDENGTTREIAPVICINREECIPYPAARVSRRKVKREMRRIRRRARKVSGFAVVVSSLFSLCTALGILYLSYNGIYAPENVCRAAMSAFEKIFTVSNGDAEKKSNASYPLPGKALESAPVYLSQTGAGKQTENPQTVFAASGLEPAAMQTTVTEEYGDEAALDVSAQTAGKSGSDGKVYLPLVSQDLSSDNLLVLSNQTRLSPDTVSLSEKKPGVYENLVLSEEPLVLILHTHATECYTEGNGGRYEKNEPTRSDDTEKNVVAVGRTLARTLTDFGIPVLHSETLHDKASFLNAYTSSLNEANKILTENPSIRFVVDLHRDAIISSDGEKTAPLVTIAGESYAQLMFVIGTNEAGFNHPDWQDNLCFALDMQKSIDEMYPGLMRPINLRSVSFNEQLSNGYVLLETGACGNTLEEAKRSAAAFGTVLAKRILTYAE